MILTCVEMAGVEMKTDEHCREGKSSVKLCQASYPVDGDLTNGYVASY
jgi:hypothetical protein